MACLFLSGRRLNATSRCQTDACERSEASPEFARGGSNAIGTFHTFLDDDVAMHGVEAGGAGLTTAKHAASLCAGAGGVPRHVDVPASRRCRAGSADAQHLSRARLSRRWPTGNFFLDCDRLERSAADTPSSEAKGSTRCWTLRTRSNHAARVTLTAPRKEMQIPSSRIPIGN